MRYLRQPNAMEFQKKLTPADETQMCAFVFDQLNTAGSGRMDGQELLISLQSTACAGLVKASVVMATLVLDDTAPLHIAPSESKSLHQITLRLFYDLIAQNEGTISRAEFLELCKLISELVAYNL